MLRLALVSVLLIAASSVRAQEAPVADTSAIEERHAFDALPLRTVAEVAALAPGVRRDLATGALTVRSRAGGPVFVVDGVRQLEGTGLPFDAVATVRTRTEGIPARLGHAAGGLVLVETEAGAEAFGGRLEAFSSRLTDAFDRDLGALSVRGPLGSLGGFSLSAEVGRAGDATPIGGPGALFLTDDAQAVLSASPQSVVVSEDGVRRTLAFPAAAARAAFDADRLYTDAELRAALSLSPDAQIQGLVSTLSTFTEDDYQRRSASDESLDDLRLAGTVRLEPLVGLRLLLGGRLDRQSGDATGPITQTQLRFSPDSGYDGEVSGQAAWLQAEHDLTPSVAYRLSASVESGEQVTYPAGYSSDVSDALGFGDLDSPQAATLRGYAQRSSGGFQPFFRTDSQGIGLRDDIGTFFLPGTQVGTFQRRQQVSTQLSGALVVRLGGARLELGADAERQSHRSYRLNGTPLAAYFADGEGVRSAGGIPPEGVRAYDELSYQVLRPLASYYGYTFDGLAEADEESIDDLFTFVDGVPVSTDIAPFQPTTIAGFAEGTGRIGPLAVRVGLRVETYDRGGETLADAFANRPVVRAGSLGSRPPGIGEDFAVYFPGGVVGASPVGFRDLDGQLFGANGMPITAADVQALNGFQAIDFNQPISAAFTSSPSHTSIQPRLGLRLDVSEALAISASYDRLTRRPPPELHSTVADYVQATGSSRLIDPRLRPEQIDAFRLGADARLSPALALTVGAFHRRGDDEIVFRNAEGALSSYSLITNAGASRETGADFALAWTPSSAVHATTGYTLSVSESTDADPTTLGVLAFLGEETDVFYAPSENGSRHEIDATVALRAPDRFGGFGLGLVLSAQSGLPYTALVNTGNFRAGDSFTSAADGELNSARLPWTSQLDLRLGKEVRVAGAAIEVFGWVENLLGTDNVLAVYRGTGEPDDDGFLSVPQRFEGQPGLRQLYSTYIDGPVNVGGAQSTSNPYFYGQPRQIRIGVRVTL